MKEKKFTVEPAPMAGYTDFAFRQVLCKCGAKVTWTEMINVTALYHGSKKTKEMLAQSGKTIVQVFGKTPEHFGAVLKSGILDGFCEININMGCPARKIISNNEGCSLMKNPELARKIIEACVANTKKPVSVKFRLGWDKNIAVDFAKMCEAAGASRIIVHGRLGTQGYSGTADWNAIADVAKAVKIPVIANGDIEDFESAKKCIEITKAAGVMIGRALIGAPWNISHKTTTSTEQKQVLKYHIDTLRKQNGNVLEFRKHLLAYISDKELKKRLCIVKSFDEIHEILGF